MEDVVFAFISEYFAGMSCCIRSCCEFGKSAPVHSKRAKPKNYSGITCWHSGALLNTASFMTVTSIGVDRMLALQLHLRYQAQVTVLRAARVVIFIRVFSGIFGTTKLWITAGLCETFSSATIVSLLVVNFVVYLKIYLIVRRHHKQIQQQRQAINQNSLSVRKFQKTALNTFLVFILLACCYMPHTVVLKMAAAGVSIAPRIYSTTITFICLNSSLNPVLHCWRDREIRTAIKQVFYYKISQCFRSR